MTSDTIYTVGNNIRSSAIDNRWKIMGLFFLVQAGGLSLISTLMEEQPLLLVVVSSLYGLAITPLWVHLIGNNEMPIVFIPNQLNVLEVYEGQRILLYGQEFRSTTQIGPRIHNILFNFVIFYNLVWLIVANAALFQTLLRAIAK